MRIIVSGTANVGKSTFIDDFIKRYPTYRKSTFNYRELLGDASTHSKHTTVELQSKILNGMINEIVSWDKDDDVIMDRGPLDNIIYTLWCYGKGSEGFDERFVSECMRANAEVSKFIDLLFFVPRLKDAPITIVDDGTRESDPVYIDEIDVLFKSVIRELTMNPNDSPMFYPKQIPGIIEIFGSRVERMELMQMYLDEKGRLLEEADSSNKIVQMDNEGKFLGDTLLMSQEEALRQESKARQKARELEEFKRIIRNQSPSGKRRR
jgi:hypothetical protein